VTGGSPRASWKASLLAAIVVALLAGGSAAIAAPTCQNHNGDAVRCGTAGALPVGQVVPPQSRPADRLANSLTPAAILGLVCVIGGVFALIALMPRFGGQWDKQQGDDDAD
jgi:hypothetical protein